MSFSASVLELVEKSQSGLVGKAPWWERVSLGQIAKILNGYPWKAAFFNGQQGIPVVRIRDVTSGASETLYNGPLEEGFWIEDGDLLVGMDGDFNSRIWTAGKALLNQRVCRIAPNENLYLKEFLALVLPGYLKLINDETHSITVKHLSSRTLSEIPLPLPSVSEQHRIVAKIDGMSAKSRRARDHLDHISRLVERYKQAILRAAYRGDLTKDWRESHPTKKMGRELRADLLSIKLERELSTRGQKDRYQPDFSLERDLPDLPQTWTWMPVEALSSKVVDGVHKKPTYVKSGVPFLTVKNLTAGNGISFSECKFVSQSDHLEFIKRTKPENGDILITKDGTLGVVRAIRNDIEFSIFVSLALVKPYDRRITDYLEFAFMSPQVQDQMVGVGSGLQHIHLTDLRRDFIPIAPPDERLEIVRRVRTALSWIDRLASETNSACILVDRLDQAIFAKAFRGELVPQEPSDEPASVLLERAKTQLTTVTPAKGNGRGRPKATATS